MNRSVNVLFSNYKEHICSDTIKKSSLCKINIQKIVISAILLLLGMILPLLTRQIKEIGDTLLPMHFPVMLCGVICGYKYGFVVGLILPFLRSVTFGMPLIYPNAVWMSAELATYGFAIGFFYHSFFKKQMWWLYCSLFLSMISGRIVWSVTKAVLLGISGETLMVQAFIAEGILDSIPGILLQFIFIPLIVKSINIHLER